MTNRYIGTSLDDAIYEQCKSPEFKELFEKERIITQIAQKIHALRQAEGISQKKFAERAHTTQQVVARLESGRDTRVPSLVLLSKLAAAVGKQAVISFR